MPTPLSDAEAEALGRRWLAAGGGWRDGMICRCDRPNDYGRVIDASTWPTDRPTWWPDLRDAATRGAALDVVRERWNDSEVYVRARGSKPNPDWAVFGWASHLLAVGPTEPEALVAALEARHAL